MASANYEVVGKHYLRLRQPDPEIARAIHAELDGMDSIVNIGAGTGSYEPLDRQIAAVEPSEMMIAQRIDKKNTKIYRASAENLPFKSNSFDAALAILTIHHWNDWQKGLQEALRVARKKIVLFSWIGMPERFWLFDYFPEIEHIDKKLFPSVEQLSTVLGSVDVNETGAKITLTENVEEGVKKLTKDLENGEWRRKYGYLRDLTEFDFGYRLIVSNRNA